MYPPYFRDRSEAGRLLATKLAEYGSRSGVMCWRCRVAGCRSVMRSRERSARRWTSFLYASWASPATKNSRWGGGQR